MEIKPLVKRLQDDNLLFNVLVDGQIVNETPLNPQSAVEAYLNTIVDKHKGAEIEVEQIQEGGNNVKLNLTTMDHPLPNQAPAPPMNGLQAVPDYNTFLFNELNNQVASLRERNKELKTENRELIKTNNENLVRINTFDREKELYIKEKDTEKTAGLSGIVDTVAANPSILESAMGILGGMMNKGAQGAPNAPVAQAKQPLTNAEKYAHHVQRFVAGQPEQVGKVFFELSQQCIEDPSILEELATMVMQRA